MDEKGTPGRNLTRRQFDEVMRRASEMASREAESGDGDLAENEIYRIAREVGLGERYVRRALVEVRSEDHDGSWADRLVGPGLVLASRVVEGKVEELAERIDEFLVAGRLLQRVRRSPDFLQYRPSVDWISQLSRAASGTSRKYYIASARSVEVRLRAVDEHRTLIEIEVDPGMRGDYMGGVLAGGGFGGVAAGVGTGVGAAVLVPEVAAVGAGIVAAGGVFTAIRGLVRRAYRRKWSDVRDEVEGVLDSLEMGERPEPPPKSWRSWVEKHFHGAKRLFDQADGL